MLRVSTVVVQDTPLATLHTGHQASLTDHEMSPLKVRMGQPLHHA